MKFTEEWMMFTKKYVLVEYIFTNWLNMTLPQQA